MTNRDEIRKAIMQERIDLGLHPKVGNQSLAESRRVLMTWTKAEIAEFYIRAESDELKAIDRAIAAEMALREHRAEAFTLNKRDIRDTPKSPEQKRAYEEWMHRNKGKSLLVDSIFLAGWNARAASDDTKDDES
ncbi:hypothetical protein [Cryobacterium sp. GrIS_2_6]|uniref:hypothetical protein n=1 Tax=Cryobacterium sp. GrIS_2_6 TaxID=3162785 RepID=UPI002DFEB1D6|nr:hypothetical protein [Cryobacterium psychrotolerans]MEC5149259.1 hypothetical protein [Cryobacterium psychrotolerans]MEC5149338.1 hypothetical protein [Cryobacterium psychrotolerans]